MRTHPTEPNTKPEAAAGGDPIASCALDPAARAAQRARYRRLAGALSRLERGPEMLTVDFDARLDRDLLEHTLWIERQCCPFFVFRFDAGRRRLTVSVREAEQAPALDVLAMAFTPSSA